MNLTVAFIVLYIMFMAVVIGWSETWKKKEHYRCRVFELSKGKEGSTLVTVKPSEPSPVPPPKRYRRLWKFVNVNNAGDNHTLNRSVLSLTSQGYEFRPEASHADYLAFMKLVEETEETEPNKIMNYNI